MSTPGSILGLVSAPRCSQGFPASTLPVVAARPLMLPGH